jgi:hypothetical protein
MMIRPATLLLPAMLLATWSSFGCEHDEVETAIGPSSIRAFDARFVSRADMVGPPDVVAVPVVAPLCPVTPPLLAPVNVTVHGDAVMASTLTGVQMQFTDVRGAIAGFRTFTHADLTTSFGTTVIPPFGVRTFPLAFPFGCTGLATGTLTVVVVTDQDGRERRSSHQLRVTTR